MENEHLMPYIRAVENDPILVQRQKQLLCLLITSIPIAPDGLVVKELLAHVDLSLASLYRVLRGLEEMNLVIFTKVKKANYVTVNFETIDEMYAHQKAKQSLRSKTLKLVAHAKHYNKREIK